MAGSLRQVTGPPRLRTSPPGQSQNEPGGPPATPPHASERACRGGAADPDLDLGGPRRGGEAAAGASGSWTTVAAAEALDALLEHTVHTLKILYYVMEARGRKVLRISSESPI